MMRVMIWVAAIAVILLLGMQAMIYADDVCKLEMCPETGTMKMTCEDSGREFFAAPALVKLMVKCAETGQMKECTFNGENIYLCVKTGRLMTINPDDKAVNVEIDGTPLFICPKTGMIVTKSPTEPDATYFEKDGQTLQICPDTGKCMMIDVKKLEEMKKKLTSPEYEEEEYEEEFEIENPM